MPDLKLGNTDITTVKLGSTQVDKVYLGSNLIWSNSPPVPEVLLGNITGTFGQEVSVPLYIKNVTDIGTIYFEFTYLTNVVQFNGVDNVTLPGTFTYAVSDLYGVLQIQGVDTIPFNPNNNIPIMYLKFILSCDQTTLAWDGTNTSYILDTSSNPIPVTWTNGIVTSDPTSIVNQSEIACDSYFWPVDNQTYTNSGIYTYTSGCTTYILNLTINPSNTITQSEVATGFYIWPVNGQYYDQSGTYTYVAGCDTYILILTIL